MPVIALIGYGSLIWDLDDLAPHVAGHWELYTGPRLPLEFSLVSSKRLQALVLVIDHDHGASCPTCVIRSRRDDIRQAVLDLAAREHASLEKIGFLERHTGSARSRSGTGLETIRQWLATTDFDGAVWADGAPNFTAVLGREFSVTAAMEHLRSLEGASADEAKRYIAMAPEQVHTPLRRALAEQSWWVEKLQ